MPLLARLATAGALTASLVLPAGIGPGTPAAAAASAASCPANSGGPVEHATAVADVEVGGCAGYLVVSAGGQVSAFGAATYHGDLASVRLNAPIVGVAATPDGGGYYLLGADGGIFSFGDARFYGSTGNIALNRPVVAMARSRDGRGYDLVASDGGVFSFGDARFYGSLGGQPPAYPVVGLGPTPDNSGYTLVDEYGQVFPFGDAQDFGSAACPVNPSAMGADPNLMADTGGGSQLITVVGQYHGSTAATLAAWSRQPDGCWSPATLEGQPAQPFTAEVGYNPASGANLEDHRSEGDGSTPTGLYGFESTMYGLSSADANPAYAYHQLVCGDWWDEQPGTAQYNEFVHVQCGTTPPFGGDSEALWQETVAYQHFAVIDFNPPPTSNPIGSGVFLHDDTTAGYTAGCVALPAGELDAVLAWMSPAAGPHIAIGTSAEMASL